MTSMTSLTSTQTATPQEAEIYLRHVEEGISIRALARELGCHASTVMRRIRKFENRRDDPLVDAALSAKQEETNADHGFQRVLRRLAEPGAELITSKDMPKALVLRDNIQTAVLDRELAEQMALRGWIAQSAQTGKVQRYVLVPMGREALRRMIAPSESNGDDKIGNDQHRKWETRIIDDPEDGRRKSRRVNVAESPLMLLARRKDQNGMPFLTRGMVAAGERLREDFELAQMGPQLAQNWDRFLTAGIHVSRNSSNSGGSEGARNRVAHALRELGPGMGDVVFRVCCFLEGIEMTERRLGWSARSGKIVLRLALMRLEKHYQDVYGNNQPLIG